MDTAKNDFESEAQYAKYKIALRRTDLKRMQESQKEKQVVGVEGNKIQLV